MVPIEGYKFQEGTKNIWFDGRMIGMRSMFLDNLLLASNQNSNASTENLPADIPNPDSGQRTEDAYRPGTADWYTWEIAAQYTAWENFKVTLTSTKGKGKTLNAVQDQAIKYEDYDHTILRDDTDLLTDTANEAKTYSDTGNHTGSATALITLAAPANNTALWTIPYAIGDIVNFTGNVDASIQGIDYVINAIDYASIDTGVIGLTFGRKEPRRNPFAPRPPPLSDMNAASGGDDTSGLEIF
jgi:hypothetical protein